MVGSKYNYAFCASYTTDIIYRKMPMCIQPFHTSHEMFAWSLHLLSHANGFFQLVPK